MNLQTRIDIQDLMGAYFPSAVLNAALELGLFWRLANGPQSIERISQEMNIPPTRCMYWLRFLANMNLLEQEGDRFGLSQVAREEILNTYSQEIWKMLAIDAQDNYEYGLSLAQNLTLSSPHQGAKHNQMQPYPTYVSYVEKMAEDPERARLFSQLLLELHTPLAQNVADALELNGARNILDVGGGSGVISHALLRKHQSLSSVVVDIPNVCLSSRAIADKLPERDRIAFYPADFVRDELPTGFDIVLECDIGKFDNALLAKLSASVKKGGRFVIVDRWFAKGQPETPSRLAYLLRKSLIDPEYSLRTLEEIEEGLMQAGLEVRSIVELNYGKWKMIEAEKLV